MPNYEVAIINADVKEAIAQNRRHDRYADEWGSTQYLDILAPNEDMARMKVSQQYPAAKGFVIEGVFES